MDEQFPLGGPYSRTASVTAAREMAELVRYLNHATQHTNVEAALPDPPTTYDVILELTTSMPRLAQLLRHLADRERAHGADPGLSADSMGPVPDGGPPIIAETAAQYLDEAADRVAAVGRAVSAAGRHASRLYVNDGTVDQVEGSPRG